MNLPKDPRLGGAETGASADATCLTWLPQPNTCIHGQVSLGGEGSTALLREGSALGRLGNTSQEVGMAWHGSEQQVVCGVPRRGHRRKRGVPGGLYFCSSREQT